MASCRAATSFCEDVGKSSWPELCGARGQTAITTIERENPSVNATIVLEGSIVTPDIRCDRVRVWVDSRRIVSRVPVVGQGSNGMVDERLVVIFYCVCENCPIKMDTWTLCCPRTVLNPK